MDWRRLLLHRNKTQGAALPQLPLPRLIHVQARAELVIPIGQQILEVVSIVPSEQYSLGWTDVLHSLAVIGLTPRWADTDVAKEFGRGHWERLWPALAGYPEVSIIFPAIETADASGFAWVPCIRMTAQGHVLTKTWLRNVRNGEMMVMVRSDFIALRLV